MRALSHGEMLGAWLLGATPNLARGAMHAPRLLGPGCRGHAEGSRCSDNASHAGSSDLTGQLGPGR